MPSLPAVLEGLETGSITIDLCGHTVCSYAGDDRAAQSARLRRELVHHFRRYLDFSASYAAQQGDASDGYAAQAHTRLLSEAALPVGDVVPFALRSDRSCAACGRRLRPYLRSATELAFDQAEDPGAPDTARCLFADGLPPLVTEVAVPSGRLVFVNVLPGVSDSPEDGRHATGWSLSSAAGRRRIAAHLAGQDVGFGQMDNMSIHVATAAAEQAPAASVFVLSHDPNDLSESVASYREDGADVPAWLAGAVAEHEAMRLPTGGDPFRLHGRLHLDVWRWMCADATTLEARGIAIGPQQEVVTLVVRPGRWRITHHFDATAYAGIVASRLEWVGPLVP